MRFSIVLALTASLVCAPLFAHADMPRANPCPEAGKSCDTAGPKFDQPGICVSKMCDSHYMDQADGGYSIRPTPCIVCEPVPAPSPSEAPAKSRFSCAFAPTERSTSAIGVAIFAVALAAKRRRARA